MTAPWFLRCTDSIRGAWGVVAGVTAMLGSEGCEVPTELCATMLTVWAMPLVNPEIVQVRVTASQVRPLGDAVARNPMIGEPPSPRGVHETVIAEFPRVVCDTVGVSGTVRGVPAEIAALLTPAADRAVTEIV